MIALQDKLLEIEQQRQDLIRRGVAVDVEPLDQSYIEYLQQKIDAAVAHGPYRDYHGMVNRELDHVEFNLNITPEGVKVEPHTPG